MLRRIRILSLLPVAMWAWKERHVLAGMAGFARTVPDRMKLGRGGEVVLAGKVNLALLREPRLSGVDVRLGAVQGGDVCLEVGPGAEAHAQVARQVVERVSGVTSVRLEDCTTTLAGQAEVAGAATITDRTNAAPSTV